MAHITPIDQTSASPEVAGIYREINSAFGRVPNLFRTYAHHPALLEANWHKVKRVMMEGNLSRKAKETIALLVSKDNGCNYCVTAHIGALKAIGVSREEISKLESDLDQADFSRKERALIKFARQANRAAVNTADG